MVAAVECRQQAAVVGRVAQGRVEVDDAVTYVL
jgi:hypothetical protein